MTYTTWIIWRKKKKYRSCKLLNERRLLFARLYEIISKFRQAQVPECTLRAVIFDWLPWVRGRALTNLLVECGREWVTARGGQPKLSTFCNVAVGNCPLWRQNVWLSQSMFLATHGMLTTMLAFISLTQWQDRINSYLHICMYICMLNIY